MQLLKLMIGLTTTAQMHRKLEIQITESPTGVGAEVKWVSKSGKYKSQCTPNTCMYLVLLEVPKQQTCVKCSYSTVLVTSFVLLHTFHVRFLRRIFQQKSQPAQHSHMQASCCPWLCTIYIKALHGGHDEGKW